MSKDTNLGGSLVFFLLGAATGAAIALLYAPQEGESTRRLIGEKAGDIKDKASDYTASVTQTAKDKWGQVADKTQDMISRGKGAAHDAIDETADIAHKSVSNV